MLLQNSKQENIVVSFVPGAIAFAVAFFYTLLTATRKKRVLCFRCFVKPFDVVDDNLGPVCFDCLKLAKGKTHDKQVS